MGAALGESGPKALLPVLDRPLIDWQLAALAEAGLQRGCLVVGNEGQGLVEHVGDGSRFGLELCIVRQEQPRGIAHALVKAAPPGDFVCLLGDVWVESTEIRSLVQALREGVDGALCLQPAAGAAARARSYAVEVASDAHGSRVTRVVEKPGDGLDGASGLGIYAFRAGLVDVARRTPCSALRGEHELTDAIDLHLREGARIVSVPVRRPDFNLSGPGDLLALNLHLLGRDGRSCFVARDAEVAADAELRTTVVAPRARVLGGARLERALVLPGQVVPAGDYRSGVFAGGAWIPAAP